MQDALKLLLCSSRMNGEGVAKSSGFGKYNKNDGFTVRKSSAHGYMPVPLKNKSEISNFIRRL